MDVRRVVWLSRDTPLDVITLAVPSSPNNLDPRVAPTRSRRRFSSWSQTLFALNERLEVAAAGERWESATPTTYLVFLRQGGVRFS